MKNFKRDFGVRGSASLIKAFKLEVEALGWKYDENFTKWESLPQRGINPLLYFCTDDDSTMKRNHFALSSSSSNDILNLPYDWNRALEIAAEVEEEVKVPETRYYKYRGSNNQSFTINKIYKLRDSHSLDSSFAFIDDSGRNNGWSSSNEDYFSPSTETEFNAQELEFKKKELLKEAKLKYPIGTKFKLLDTEDIVEVEGIPYYSDFDNNIIWNSTGFGRLYSNGRWATIIEDELKVGDYIIAEGSGSISPRKLVKFQIDGAIFSWNEYPENNLEFIHSWEFKKIRKATPKEIAGCKHPKEDTIEIAGYKSEVKDDKIAFGCKKFSRENLLAIEEVIKISKRTNLEFTFRDDEMVTIEYDDETYPIHIDDIRKLISKCPQF